MAGNLLMSVSQEEKERAINRSRRMYETDLASNLATAEDIGEKRGEKRKALTIAQNLLELNLSIEQIVSATGLTYDEVNQMKKVI